MRRGELVSAAEVRTAAFAEARRARERLYALPDRLSPVLAALNDADACHAALLEAVEEICTEISRGPRRRGRRGKA